MAASVTAIVPLTARGFRMASFPNHVRIIASHSRFRAGFCRQQFQDHFIHVALAVSAGAVLGRYHYAADAFAGWAVALIVWVWLR